LSRHRALAKPAYCGCSMRKIFRAAIVLGIVSVAALLISELFPDQVYASLEWGRYWVRILSSRNSYGFPASRDDPKLRLDGHSLAPPFMLRKSIAPPKLYVDAEGYRVFEAWLSTVRVSNTPLIHSESAALLMLEPIEQCFPSEVLQSLADALADFSVKNSETWRFDVRAIKNTRLGGPTRESGLFQSEISFSAVGFNRDRTAAVMYATYWCGPRCARGTYYALDKRDGQWINVREIGRCGWTS